MQIEMPSYLAVIVFHAVCKRLQDVSLSNNHLISEYGLDPDRGVEKMLRRAQRILENSLEKETGKVPENLYP
jgi:hypothetical protein